MRLIDADLFYKAMQDAEELARRRVRDTESTLPYPTNLNPAYTRYLAQMDERTKAKEMVADAPTVDAVPVVRCKDCKHWRNFVRSPIQDEVIKSGKLWKYCCKVNEMMPEDGYCHRAERERKNELER